MVKKQTSIRMSDTAKELVVLLATRHYIIDADPREDRIEFQEAGPGIAPHNAYVANHHHLAAASKSIVPAGLLLIARTTRPSHTGQVLDTFGETPLLLYHHDEYLVGKRSNVICPAATGK